MCSSVRCRVAGTELSVFLLAQSAPTPSPSCPPPTLPGAALQGVGSYSLVLCMWSVPRGRRREGPCSRIRARGVACLHFCIRACSKPFSTLRGAQRVPLPVHATCVFTDVGACGMTCSPRRRDLGWAEAVLLARSCVHGASSHRLLPQARAVVRQRGARRARRPGQVQSCCAQASGMSLHPGHRGPAMPSSSPTTVRTSYPPIPICRWPHRLRTSPWIWQAGRGAGPRCSLPGPPERAPSLCKCQSLKPLVCAGSVLG